MLHRIAWPASTLIGSLALGLALLGLGAQPLFAQTRITWEDLADVTFTDVYREEMGTVYPRADFGKTPRRLSGQQVMLIGYLLPMDVGGKAYALSASPFAACFFCGQSGPETVMELELRKTESWFAMDRLVLVRGRLRLNADDPSRLYYVLELAEVMERLDQ
jgi:hypothetical protein